MKLSIDLRTVSDDSLKLLRGIVVDAGRADLLSSISDEQEARRRPRRTGVGETFVGPVSVRLSDAFGGRSYAFHTDIPVAKYDTVDVETIHGDVEGKVVAQGTNGFCGPLRPVLAVKAVY